MIDEAAAAGSLRALVLGELAKWAPVVIVLAAILWYGARGGWYWGKNVRRVVASIERDRDHWRALAVSLLKEKGIDVVVDSGDPPPDVLSPSTSPAADRDPS